jgi:hypothetical protein
MEYPQIGRFYNGRHHTTVLYAIKKIEQLGKLDESVDALLEVLSDDLRTIARCSTPSRPLDRSNTLLDALAERMLRHLTRNETPPAGAGLVMRVPSEQLAAVRRRVPV